MSERTLQLGRSGEELAEVFLKKSGYKILARNYKTKLGEVDIIAREKDCICFIEVKARNTADFGLPKEAVCARKQRQISKAALVYLKDNKLLDKSARFDVVSVLLDGSSPKIELIRNAFELDSSFAY
ncbi:MAG: YraN family protein [Candidatus Omnitrophica bacterium]|nr:YraN family protein [Candidatus Omnitrophota bacterium]